MENFKNINEVKYFEQIYGCMDIIHQESFQNLWKKDFISVDLGWRHIKKF